jgi:sodium transport system ATP-binding protein
MLVYTARLQWVVEPEARAEALLQRFELGPHAHQRNERLSTGNRQKVNIARAIVHDPPIIIFDEPTLGLDVMVSQILLEFVEEARSAGRCVIYSTHIMSEAERLSDRLAIIHGGKVLATGTLDALREQTGARHLEDVFIRAVRRAEASA